MVALGRNWIPMMPWCSQRRGGKIDSVASRQYRQTRRGRRAALCGRFLPQYCLLAEQELHPRRKHRSYCNRKRGRSEPASQAVLSMREIQAGKRTMVEGLVQNASE